jgi:hypothetical protein
VTIGETWKSWYPQEWVSWVMYEVPSENPTEHWVNQPISEGPTDMDTDEKGVKSSKRPPGTMNQREKVTVESVQSKQSSDSNTLRAQHLKQVAEEMETSRKRPVEEETEEEMRERKKRG